MALPHCARCGKRNPQLMHGLMTLWFGPLVELEADLGYFHLCPACHDEVVVPELERIQNRILELHPAAQRSVEEAEEAEETEVGAAGGAASDETAADERGPAEDESPAENETPAEDESPAEDEFPAEDEDATR